MKELRAKIKEALMSVLPITAMVYLLAATPLLNLTRTEFVTFTVGAVMLILGIGLFSMGADLAMTPMGAHVGSGLSKQKKLGLLLGVCFVLGVLITIAEPDLQVLAGQVQSVINGTVLTYAVGVGVGVFLVVAILKIVFQKSLSQILMLFYMLLFALSLLLAVGGKLSMLPVAFDSGALYSGCLGPMRSTMGTSAICVSVMFFWRHSFSNRSVSSGLRNTTDSSSSDSMSFSRATSISSV